MPNPVFSNTHTERERENQIKLLYHFCSLSSLPSTGNKRTKRISDKPGSFCALIKVSASFDGAVSVKVGGLNSTLKYEKLYITTTKTKHCNISVRVE